ncbi:MAG: sulfite exporter TauE/SafE family protein [Cyanobium sp.]
MALSGLVLLGLGGGLIGFLLSVLGAGGSILLLPLLVSGASLPTKEAVPLSLLVVTLLALASLGPYLRRGQFAARPALLLGVPALAGSWLGGSWIKAGWIPEPVQLGVFAAAAVVAAWLLNRPDQRRTERPSDAQTSPLDAPEAAGGRERPLLLVQGGLVGLLTGIAGVGGGFAIVPALVLLAGLPMPRASGTSLLLIAANALVALAALGHWPARGLPLLLPLLLGGGIGAWLGQRLAPRCSDQGLRRGFSLLLIASALLSGLEAWKRQPIPPFGTTHHRVPQPFRPGITSTGSNPRPTPVSRVRRGTGGTVQA